MKKLKVGLIALACMGAFSAIAINRAESKEMMNVSAYDKMGKWIFDYGGNSIPFMCRCVPSYLHTECIAGEVLYGGEGICE